MIPRVIPASRQLSSVPQIHSAQTLRSIAGKTHEISERIEFLKIEATRWNHLLNSVPDDSVSRLDWLARQLNQP